MNRLLEPKFNTKTSLDDSLKKVFSRITYLIDKNFDAKIVFRSFSFAGTTEENSLKKLLLNNNPLKLAGKALFPISITLDKNKLAYQNIIGFFQVSPAQDLNNTELLRLKDLLDLLITNNINTVQSFRSLSNATKTEPSPARDNVIQMNHYNKTSSPISDFAESSTKELAAPKSDSIFIYSKSLEDLHKLAFEIHAKSKRFAFLNIEDIDIDSLNFEDFKSFGDMSIFIPNIVNLDLRRQSLLKKILSKGSQYGFPVIISGSSRTQSYLAKYNLIDSELLKKLSLINFYMSKSFNDYKKTGLIEELL